MHISLKAISSLAVFSGEVLANPGPVGAAVPSSRALARRIASFLPCNPKGFVIELGAGTGAVTEALLEHGLPASRVIPVELSANMVRHLQKRFPQLSVLGGNAAKLGELLAQELPQTKGRISHIVSSLPLRSLPIGVVARIVREVKRLLPVDGTFIQYTYNVTCRRYRPLEDFLRTATATVWLNLPPARVDVYRPRA
jgi:phospholipid N-methyltransferase